MNDISGRTRLRSILLSGAAALLAAAIISPGVAKGQSSADIGVSHPPLVTIIFDSSSSMQWVEQGEGHYPTRIKSSGSKTGSKRDARIIDRTHLDTWKTGTHLCLPGSIYKDGTSADRGCLGTTTFEDNLIPKKLSEMAPVVPVETVGPCMVWHPMGNSSVGPVCGDDYTRPTTCADDHNLCRSGFQGKEDLADNWTKNKLMAMRRDLGMRLVDEQTPRHIQVKQILTGDMIFEYRGDDGEGDPVRAGPGCWFVPRGRGTSNDQVCCDYLDEFGLCAKDPNSSRSYTRGFDSFIDHDDPIPHYQEVYDFQEKNGLLDAMARTALFSVVMFDSYRGDGRKSDGWDFPMNDIVAGNSPYSNSTPTFEADGQEGGKCGTEDCYDLGFFRFVGPTKLEIPEDEMVLLSDYVQDAIRDAGYLRSESRSQVDYLTGQRVDEDGKTKTIDVFSYPLSKQPMANASPFGAVFHDLHQLFLNGQYAGLEDIGDQERRQEAKNPFADDHYKACRARHVVMFTDGVPEPEAGGGFGSESLNEAYGYQPERFPYLMSERAIEEMILDVMADMQGDQGGQDPLDPRFIPRVHVLAVSKEEESEHWDEVIKKIASMAAAGRTCAQYYLPPEMIPAGVPTGHIDENGDRVMGTCDPTESDAVCLVKQDIGGSNHSAYTPPRDSGYYYEPPDGSDLFECDHPALLLTRNDRTAMVKAFQMIFNEIASDLVTRTRPSVTNYLDYDDKAGQYRLFSGVKIGGNVHWKGLLNRQLLECSYDESGITVDVSEMRPLHNDINRLRLELTKISDDGDDEDIYDVDGELPHGIDEDMDSDRRRVFTTFPSYLWGVSEAALRDAAEAEKFFDFTYKLHGADSDKDQFGSELEMPGYSSKPKSNQTRIPFTVPNMLDFIGHAGNSPDELYKYLGIGSEQLDSLVAFNHTVDRYRGRLGVLADRVLGGIYNSNPATVGPPDLDLPIDSYRDFRSVYTDRPAMTYVSTVDGLLHAIYAGEPEVRVRDLEGNEDKKGAARLQREAWAYIPQLLHQELAVNADRATQLMDGSPVVADIRLCHRQANANSNPLACPGNADGTDSSIPSASQWRTVLVQGLGTGAGYFALDVTRAGDKATLPDPLVLWEFGPRWEEVQLHGMSEDWRVKPEDPASYIESLSQDCKGLDDAWVPMAMPMQKTSTAREDSFEIDEIWKLSHLGVSVAEPALGVVPMKLSDEKEARPVQRAVAIFGGGSAAGAEPRFKECLDDITGKAIYVVDLQTGEIIRRFVQYQDGDDWLSFDAVITGTPVMSASMPGESSTRAFIGDNNGRLFRVDMTSSDPEEWKVGLFFDPEDPGEEGFLLGEAQREEKGFSGFGPASFPPAITTNRKRNLVIAYGLGHRGDTGGRDTLQAIIALEEERTAVEDSHEAGDATPIWRLEFEEGERLTGAPVAFDNDFFFTTYVEPEDDVCKGGTSRMYRLNHQKEEFDEDDAEADRWGPTGAWSESAIGADQTDHFLIDEKNSPPHWFGPKDPTLIRGLTITMGPMCIDTVDDDDDEGAAQEGPPQKPQLIAQTGTANVGEKGGSGIGGGSDPAGMGSGMSRIAVELETPRTRALPMNWMVIGN